MESVKPRVVEQATVALIVIIATVPWLGSLSQPFFADDYLFLEQVRGKTLWGALTSADPIGNYFRPLSRAAYFWIIAHTAGESPRAYHAASLLLFATILVVFYVLVRRLGGRRLAVFATALVSVHYAFAVPLQWASGSQDLLALLLGTIAILLYTHKRRWAAAAVLLLALLSKEVVIGAVIVALLVDRQADEQWRATLRRGLPLFICVASWLCCLCLALKDAPLPAQLGNLLPNLVAGAVHGLQVMLGLEFREAGAFLGHWRLVSIATAALLAGTQLIGSNAHEVTDSGNRRGALLIGLSWFVSGIAPIAAVAPIWSAYFYGWAVLGGAVLVGVLAVRQKPLIQAIILGGLAVVTINAGHLDEFALNADAWAWQSHVNERYVVRSSEVVSRYLHELRSGHHMLPHRATVFFANVPPSSGWQAGDGAILRWAYRDSSLRSYYLTEFTRERAMRGPVLFYAVDDGMLKDHTHDQGMLRSIAYSMLLADKPGPAIQALSMSESACWDSEAAYWRGLSRMALADSGGAVKEFGLAMMRTECLVDAHARSRIITIADTSERIRELMRWRRCDVLDPWVHARLAAVLLARGDVVGGTIEAYAYKVLAPAEADVWRKWASAELLNGKPAFALAALERYSASSGPAGERDAEVKEMLGKLRRIVNGDLARRSLRDTNRGL